MKLGCKTLLVEALASGEMGSLLSPGTPVYVAGDGTNHTFSVTSPSLFFTIVDHSLWSLVLKIIVLPIWC
jgi:hypothetical protein